MARWASVARVGLTGLVLAAAGGALIASAAAADRRVDRARAAARADAVRGAGQAVATGLASAIAQAHGVGAAIHLGPTPAQSQDLAGALAGADLLDDGAYVVDARGAVVVTTVARADLAHLLRTWPELDVALHGASISGLYEDPLEHTVDLLVAAPALPGTAIVGRTRVPGGNLARAVSQIPIPSGTQLLVVDGHNELVNGLAVSPPGVEVATGLRAMVQAGRTGAAGLGTARAEGGAALAVAHAPAGNGWVVLITQPAGAWNARAGHVAATVAPPVVVAWALALILAVLAEVRHDRQAHQVERATSAFLAVAGHELRTPLTSIRGFSQTLAQRWDSLPAGRRQEMVQAIARQSRLLEHLIERLLTAARLEAGTSSTLLLGPVDLTAVLQDVVEAHQPLAPLHEIRVEMAPGLTVHGDGGALGQVLGHLVENAVKYSPGGGLVTVSATRLRRRVEVAVEDDGVGLPSDFPRLFDRFAQAEPVDTRTYDEGGMGLGLFIARTLVEQMGGVIRAEPRQPRGARFVVRLVAAGDD